MPAAAEVREALDRAAEALSRDLDELFGFADAETRVLDEGGPPRLVVEGAEGRFEVAWPPDDGLTEAEGRLGGHARIALELLLAAETPAAFFEDYRPVSDERRRIVFVALKAYVDDSLGENPYYSPLAFVERGPVALVYGDDEYAIVAADGSHEGSGILHWKVKRLLAFALTDADAELLDDETPPS